MNFMNQIMQDLDEKSDQEKIRIFQRFFKTGKGEYGEGDQFIGISVPQNRKVAKKHSKATLDQIKELLNSPIHEHRLCALLILVDQYNRAEQGQKNEIFQFYLANLERVNNWDLVDSSADKIIGAHIFQKDKKLLYQLVNSENIWKRRISIISTFYFIKKGKFEDTIKIAEILLKDKEDLIHKAVGWMLREMGKRKGEEKLMQFLNKHSKKMPRTMLRYAIEKLDENQKREFMKK